MTKSSKKILSFGAILLITIYLVQFASSDQRICGPGLRKTLDLVCPNGFNGFKVKRNPLTPGGDYIEYTIDTFDLNMMPFMTKDEANNLIKTRRRRHGIVHECCDKPCSMDELRSYCRRPTFP